MPNTWTPENERLLLLQMFSPDVNFSRQHFEAVATRMNNGVSGESCR